MSSFRQLDKHLCTGVVIKEKVITCMHIKNNNIVITMLLFELFRYLFMHSFKLNFLTLNTEFLYK